VAIYCQEGKGKKMSGYNVGDVVVFSGNPPEGNPYRGGQVWGGCRVEALRKFKHGEDVGDFTFWHVPLHGGVSQCTREEVNWGTSNIA
jgi:hypothetical protein